MFLIIQFGVFACGTGFQYSKSKISRVIGRVLQVLSGLAIVIYLIVHVVHSGLY